MISVSANQLATILGAKLLGNSGISVTGSAETDSRLVNPGSIFFAKPGAQADGHDFVADAKSRGAVVAVVERPVDVDMTQLIVANTVDALGTLAAWLIGELKSNGKLKVVGITGSNGKTTTKNMLRAILSQVGNTIAPIESSRLGANRQPLAANRYHLCLYSKLNSLSVDSVGGGSPARMVRTKSSRCSAQGPWARRASTCSGVP